MPHAIMPATGFQAFILCGPGASLNPFNSNPNDSPKALIPIANRPMVWYALEWCYRMGVTDINLITPSESRAALDAALSQNPHLTSLPSPKASIIAPSDLDQTTGTGEIFRLPEVQKEIVSDFIVLPCDIVCELNGLSILESWMILQGDLASQAVDQNSYRFSAEKLGRRGGLGVWYQTKDSDEGGVGVKKEDTDFLGTVDLPDPPVTPAASSIRQRLRGVVLSMPTAALKDDIEEKKNFQMRHALLRGRGKIKLNMSYRDAHIYFFPLWVKDFMNSNETFESLSEDVVGWWAKAGWQQGLAQKLGLDTILAPKKTVNNRQHLDDMVDEMEEDIAGLSTTFTTATTTNGPQVDSLPNGEQNPTFAKRVHDAPPTSTANRSEVTVPQLIAYIHPSQPAASLLRRIDTVPLLLSASLFLAKLPSASEAQAAGTRPSPLAHVHKISTTVTKPQQITLHEPTTLVDANVTLTPKSTIRESVVGANCVLGTPDSSGAGVRLSRCLLMEGVSIESGTVLNGCVLGRRCKIGQGCDLRDCYVQDGYVVPGGTTAKGEVFAGFDEGTDGEDFGDEDIYEDMGVEEEGGIAIE